MKPSRRSLLAGAVAAAAGAAGVGVALLRRSRADGSEALQRARFLDLQGRTRSLDEWSRNFLLVNFWATWCAPCLEEIPMLGQLRRAHQHKSFEIVGIAIDQATKVAEMSARLSIEYPILLADVQGLQLLRELGNASGGLPYTVLLNPGLRPSETKLGALKRDEAEAMVARLLVG